jgi:hypothetical protein
MQEGACKGVHERGCMQEVHARGRLTVEVSRSFESRDTCNNNREDLQPSMRRRVQHSPASRALVARPMPNKGWLVQMVHQLFPNPRKQDSSSAIYPRVFASVHTSTVPNPRRAQLLLKGTIAPHTRCLERVGQLLPAANVQQSILFVWESCPHTT